MAKDEKLLLSIFIAAQFSRTKQRRTMLKQINDAMVEHIKRMGGNPDNVEGFTPANEDEINEFSIITLRDSVNNFAPLFYSRAWMLFKATKTSKYYISDNPITLHNENKFGAFGNLGLAVKGIEIYFPISSELSVGIFDNSITAQGCERKNRII